MVLEKIKPKEKNTPTPHTRQPCVLPRLLPTSPRVSGVDCGQPNKLTWLFWAKRQEQACQWARHKTPQRQSQNVFSLCFPSVRAEIWIVSEGMQTLLFLGLVLLTVCYKCLWWETELFLWFWLHKVVIPVWYTAQSLRWGVLETCSHSLHLWIH